MSRIPRFEDKVLYADFLSGKSHQQISAERGYTVQSVRRKIRNAKYTTHIQTSTVIPFPDETARKAIEILNAPTEAEDIEAVLEKHALEDMAAIEAHVRKLQAAGDYWKVLAIYDPHIPDHHEASFRLHVQIAARLQPAMIVWGGDVFDFEHLSKYPASNRSGKRDVLNPIRQHWPQMVKAFQTAAPNALQILMDGNHEKRLQLFNSEHIEIGDTVEQQYAHLIRQGGLIKWRNRKHEVKLPNLLLQHGKLTSEHAALNALKKIGMGLTYAQGHIHKFQKYVRVQRTDTGRRLVITVAAPCSCNIPASYERSNFEDTPDWVHGCISHLINPHDVDVHEAEYLYHPRKDGSLATVFGAEMLTSEPPDIRYDKGRFKQRAA